MKAISDLTALVIDHGLFVPVARRLAEAYKRVLYWTPHEDGFSTIRKGIIGDGFPDIEWCDDPWKVKGEVDMLVAPDVELSGIQLEYEAQGIPVWGSRAGDEVELNRLLFLRLLEELGLDVPFYKRFKGLTRLREYLKDQEDKYIKISRWRGDFETAHWRNFKEDEGLLDALAVRLGPAKEIMTFLVFDAIDTDIEIGGDTYCVDGAWPQKMLVGTEWKDKAYFGVVMPTNKTPHQIQVVLSAFAQEFEAYRYRNQFSCEIRVKGDKFFFIDPTCRGGLPSTGSQLKLWKNFPEIVWEGANGILIDPVPAAKYSAECVLKVERDPGTWATVDIPDELKPWAMLSNCGMIDGRFVFSPNEHDGKEIGWLVAIGDTPKETIQRLGEYVAKLPDGVTSEFEALANIIVEVEEAESENIPMTEEPMPDPGIVLEEKR